MWETKTWEHVWEGCGIGGIRGGRVGRKRAVGYWGRRGGGKVDEEDGERETGGGGRDGRT